MRPSRVVVTVALSPFVFIVDYFQSTLSIQAVPTGGASYWIEATADDVNDLTVTPTWFPVTNGGTSGVPLVASAFIPSALFPVRALRYNVTVGGSVAFTVLQSSGSDGLSPGDPLNA